MKQNRSHELKIGWASTDITPVKPVQLAGQFHVRISEGVLDPVTATALSLSSGDEGLASAAVMVSCDLVSISASLITAVRDRLRAALPELDPLCVYLNATHTHTAPEVRTPADQKLASGIVSSGLSIELPGMDPEAYVLFAAERIAQVVVTAWRSRSPGTVGYGLGQAVVGHNRRSSYFSGESRMYGNTAAEDFSHIEGFEDHGVNMLATWDAAGGLTGLVINVACPSQVTEQLFQVSADYWHETRMEVRRRLGAGLFILPQCSAAGDQSPHIQVGKAAEEHMLRLAGRTQRQEIAIRIADAVEATLPLIATDQMKNPPLAHRVETLELSRRRLSTADVTEALGEAEKLRGKYEALLDDLKSHPDRRKELRWYVPITEAYRRMQWNAGVKTRYEIEQTQPRLPVEVHVLRVGDLVFASNPFEYYLDFGVQIKARSPAIQSFLVQLTGAGTYVPTLRAIAGKSYGALPASTSVGPEGGRELVDWTVAAFKELWAQDGKPCTAERS